MPYIDRDESGNIVGLYACQQHEGQEYLEGATLHVPPVPIQAQIETLERDAMMPHGVRVFMIGSMEKEAIELGAARVPPLSPAQSKAALRLGNPGYRRLMELHEQITALEAML
jgi:hypothetical protein